MKKRFCFLLILGIFLCFQYGLFPFFTDNRNDLRIIAHRGDNYNAPENTLPAVAAAIKNNARHIELDVRCTGDKIPVVFHDSDLRRLTGIKKPLSEINCNDFLSLSVCDNASGYPSTTPCTLEQVLVFCSDYPDLCLHLELKISGIEEKVVSLLQKYDSGCSYEISSKNPMVLKKIKQQKSDVKTFLLLSSAKDIYHYISRSPDNLDGISVKSTYVTAAFTAIARKRGHIIYCWTVNDRFHVQRLKHLKVDAVITDNPSLLRKMLS